MSIALFAKRRQFSPSSLFAANEQGAWYDPSDLSTLFQDSAGTTPVTAVEQPVGLVLDKSRVAGVSLVGGSTTIATGANPLLGIVISPDGLSVYVANRPDNTLSIYSRNTSTGALTANGTIATGTFPNGVGVSPDGLFVYTTNTNANTVSIYSRNTSTGALTIADTISAGTNPNYIAISPDGAFVYISSGTTNDISIYSRNTSTGALTAGGTIAAGTSPRAIAISSDGTSLYVPSNGTSTVLIYSRNTSTGALTAGGTIASSANPQGIVISPDGISVYVTSTNGNNISIYSRNTSTGALTSAGTIATGTNPYAVVISPDGKSVYATSASSNIVSIYTRNTSTGVLTANGTLPTGSGPYGLAITSDGASVYAVNNGSSTLSIYKRTTSGNPASQSTAAKRPVLSARYNQLLDTETLATQNVTTVATNYTLAFSGAGSITLSGTKTGTYTAGTNTLTGVTAGTLTLTVSGSVTKADLRHANDGIGLPAYQRVTTASDYDTAGFPPRASLDGVDDSLGAAAGGGSTTGFFFCAAIRANNTGATQTIWSDTGTNTGYRVRINSSNQLEMAVGNGSAYTTVNTTATLAIGQRAILTCWHDGANIYAQIDLGAIASTAFATASAGTAGFTVWQDNGASSNYFKGGIFGFVQLKDVSPSEGIRAQLQRYLAQRGLIAL